MKIKVDESMTKCFKNSYNDYTKEKFNVEANINGNEILSDVLTFKTLFRASKKSRDDNLFLLGINLNKDRLFWVALTQRFCSFEKDIETTKNKIASGTIPINQYRSEIPMRFNEEFKASFNCEKVQHEQEKC